MWKSPIDIGITEISEKITNDLDRQVIQAVHQVGISVNKDELIKALEYDRDQYEKGFSDGVKSEQKTGRWNRVDYGTYKFKCDQCGNYHRAMYDYCPSCGAKMRGGEDESNT